MTSPQMSTVLLTANAVIILDVTLLNEKHFTLARNFGHIMYTNMLSLQLSSCQPNSTKEALKTNLQYVLHHTTNLPPYPGFQQNLLQATNTTSAWTSTIMPEPGRSKKHDQTVGKGTFWVSTINLAVLFQHYLLL